MTDLAKQADELHHAATIDVDFLIGTGPNARGHWFGDDPDKPRGNFWWRQHLASVRLALTLVPAMAARIRELEAGPKIKPLVWVDRKWLPKQTAETAFGEYYVYQTVNDDWRAEMHGWSETFPTREAAVAAAEADYERRVRELLE